MVPRVGADGASACPCLPLQPCSPPCTCSPQPFPADTSTVRLAAGGSEGKSGIAALLRIVTATPSKAGKQGGGGKAAAAAGTESDSEDEGEAERGAAAAPRASGKQRKQRVRPLLRPIICICNDLYAPALRPLRDVARVFHFKKPQVRPPCMPERLLHAVLCLRPPLCGLAGIVAAVANHAARLHAAATPAAGGAPGAAPADDLCGRGAAV